MPEVHQRLATAWSPSHRRRPLSADQIQPLPSSSAAGEQLYEVLYPSSPSCTTRPSP